MTGHSDTYAEVFAAAGLGVVVFDHRNFGASGGAPRGEIDPWAQVRDYRHAISFARTLPERDPARLGIWGISFSGGHVLVGGALDRRVRCVVSQVPAISGYRASLRRVPSAQVPPLLEAYERALQPKHLVLIPGGHFVPYVQECPASSAAARDLVPPPSLIRPVSGRCRPSREHCSAEAT